MEISKCHSLRRNTCAAARVRAAARSFGPSIATLRRRTLPHAPAWIATRASDGGTGGDFRCRFWHTDTSTTLRAVNSPGRENSASISPIQQ